MAHLSGPAHPRPTICDYTNAKGDAVTISASRGNMAELKNLLAFSKKNGLVTKMLPTRPFGPGAFYASGKTVLGPGYTLYALKRERIFQVSVGGGVSLSRLQRMFALLVRNA